MRRKIISVPAAGIFSLLLLSPVLISSTGRPVSGPALIVIAEDDIPEKKVSLPSKTAAELLTEKANKMYDSMRLRRAGLSRKAFECAYKGYYTLRRKGRIKNSQVLSICDFSQSSRRKRLYVINMKTMKLMLQTYVAHGKNSGREYAKSFSNSPESHKSSLGFFVTGGTYYGEHGLSLRVKGMERGINCRANARNIVIHGSRYVGEKYLRSNRLNGRSFGCPAVPAEQTEKVINTIKNGSCMFIYHPTKHYLAKSTILNG